MESNLDEIIKQLKEENSLLKQQLETTKIQLKKYTAPARNRNRYNPEKAKEYQAKINPEKKKEKIKKQQENQDI